MYSYNIYILYIHYIYIYVCVKWWLKYKYFWMKVVEMDGKYNESSVLWFAVMCL